MYRQVAAFRNGKARGEQQALVQQFFLGALFPDGDFCQLFKLLGEGKVKLPPIELYDLKDFEKAFASRAFKAGFAL